MEWNAKTWKPILEVYAGASTYEDKQAARLRALEDDADADRTRLRDFTAEARRELDALHDKLQETRDFGDGLATAAGRDRQMILDLQKLFEAAQEGRAEIMSRVELAQDRSGHNKVRIEGLEKALGRAHDDTALLGEQVRKAQGVGDSNAARITGLQAAKSKLHDAVESVERKVEGYDRLAGAVESLQTDVRRLNAKVNAVLEVMPGERPARKERANGASPRSVADKDLLPFGETLRCIIRKVDREPGRTMLRRELRDWISATLGYKREGAHIPIAALVKRRVFDEEDKRKYTSRVTLRDPSSWTPGVR